MRVAVIALRELGPRAIIAALPVASRDALRTLAAVADACVCLVTPDPFFGVGLWYKDFSETSEAEVRVLLAAARRRWETATPVHAQLEI
jgi:predicted phosphoribosyltransferase